MNKLISIFVLTLFAVGTQAQTIITKNPVQNETKVKQQLFNIDTDEENYFFKIALPEDNFLVIDFFKLSYWPDSSDLQSICDIAAKTIEDVDGTFKNDNVSKRVDIHLPQSNYPVTARLKEHDDGATLVVISKGESSNLKIGMDTIRVLKTYGKTKDIADNDKLAQVQYTFILKNIADIDMVAANKAIIADVAHTLDSIVHAKRKKWHAQDVWYHKVWVDYQPLAKEDKLKVRTKEPLGFLSGVDVDYYIGGTIFRNTVAPHLEMGASYKFPADIGEYGLIRFSMMTIPQFEKGTTARYDFYNTTFLCLDFGLIQNKTRSRVPLYNTSIGFGYMLTDHPSLVDYRAGYKMFFHYGLSPAIRITGDLYLMDIKGEENRVWSGLTVAFRLL